MAIIQNYIDFIIWFSTEYTEQFVISESKNRFEFED